MFLNHKIHESGSVNFCRLTVRKLMGLLPVSTWGAKTSKERDKVGVRGWGEELTETHMKRAGL